jgi:hypothetical protein
LRNAPPDGRRLKLSMNNLRKKALNLLTSAYFFSELRFAFRRAGLVGERRNALIVYVVGTSRLLTKPLCLLIRGSSGAGKNFLADTALGFLPASEVEQLTSSSTRSWNYLDNKLAHKVIYVKERNEAAGLVHPTHLLISEQQLIHIVTVKKRGKFVLERRVTKGPIASISTTTKNQLEIDDETRHISIWLDESPDQTKRIMQAAVEEQRPLTLSERKVWHNVQKLIQKRAALTIEFPAWFEHIVPNVRSDNLSARRYFNAFLEACRTVALIRSFSRKAKTAHKSKRIVVRFTDFAVTALIFNGVFEHSIDRADDYDLEIQQHVKRISFRNDGTGVSASDLAEETNISVDRAYSALRKALNAGAICRANRPSRANRKLFLPAKPRPFLPDPEELFQKLEALPERVAFVHPVSGKWVTYRHKRSEQED